MILHSFRTTQGNIMIIEEAYCFPMAQISRDCNGEFFNVSRATNVPIWLGCCEFFAVRNISSIPILVQNANLVIVR